MKLYIKNMVCRRCIMVVSSELEKLGLHPESVELGEAELAEQHLSESQKGAIDNALQAVGFERIDDRKSRLIAKMKSIIIETIDRSDGELQTRWSDLIASELHYEYNHLSNLFSSVEGITLEQYIIRQKVEKAKELLVYDELTLSEIAWKLGYSSPAYLSSQFKKVTGLTASHFKKLKDKKRKPLDDV